MASEVAALAEALGVPALVRGGKLQKGTSALPGPIGIEEARKSDAVGRAACVRRAHALSPPRPHGGERRAVAAVTDRTERVLSLAVRAIAHAWGPAKKVAAVDEQQLAAELDSLDADGGPDAFTALSLWETTRRCGDALMQQAARTLEQAAGATGAASGPPAEGAGEAGEAGEGAATLRELYMGRVAANFADDLERVRQGHEFTTEDVGCLIDCLEQGHDLFAD